MKLKKDKESEKIKKMKLKKDQDKESEKIKKMK